MCISAVSECLLLLKNVLQGYICWQIWVAETVEQCDLYQRGGTRLSWTSAHLGSVKLRGRLCQEPCFQTHAQMISFCPLRGRVQWIHFTDWLVNDSTFLGAPISAMKWSLLYKILFFPQEFKKRAQWYSIWIYPRERWAGGKFQCVKVVLVKGMFCVRCCAVVLMEILYECVHSAFL